MQACRSRKHRGGGAQERHGPREATWDPGGHARAHGQGEGSDPGREVRPSPMAADQACFELLFSYGTLQLEAVQLATFGRPLTGTDDALQGFDVVDLEIEDQAVVAISGRAHHTMARFTGRASDVVSGVVFAVTPAEIQNADKYEVTAVKRVAVVLQSGA